MFQKIDVFKNSEVIYLRKESSSIITWSNILILGLFLFIIVCCFYKFDIKNYYYAKVVNLDEENYVKLNVDESFIQVKNRNFFTIDNSDYKCHLLSFSDNYIIIEQKKYWEATYECELPDEINVNDNILKVQINKRTTTLLKEFIIGLKKRIENKNTKN